MTHAASPPGGVRIGVVGGAGGMGTWLRRFWADLGCPVRFSDRGTELSNRDLLLWADITFVSVPLHATPAVLRELAPLAGTEQALVSIASLMSPSAEALAGSRGQALCAHPVFGPTVATTRGLPVVIAPLRGDRWSSWLAETLRAAGLAVRISTPDAHDATMAMVQAMLHSLYVALCHALTDRDLPIPEALAWASPSLYLQLGLAARILGQDAELYADLVVGNPHAPAALDALAARLQDLAACARSGDRDAFIAAFVGARDGFEDRLSPLATAAERALAHLP